MNKKVCNLLDNILRIIIVILILVKIINLEFEDIQIIDPETPITREEYENYK